MKSSESHTHRSEKHDHSKHHKDHHAHIAMDARSLTIALICTSAIFLAEIIGGYISNSMALLSDAGHMLSDVAALGIALFALKMYVSSQNNIERRHRFTFGFRRLEVLAALVNGVALLGICLFLVVESLERLFSPEKIELETMMITAAIGLVANGISAAVLFRSHHLSARSAYLHVLVDLLSSVAVIAGGAAMYFTGIGWIDPALSILISASIVRSAVRLVKSAGTVLMNSAPKDLTAAQITTSIAGISGVHSVHDVHIWESSPGEHLVSAHIIRKSSEDAEAVLEKIRALLLAEFKLEHSTIQVESEQFSENNSCSSCSLS